MFLLGFVYFLSIYTYDDLDFTKLLLLLFITFNISIVPQIVIKIEQTDHKTIPQPTPTYFTVYIIELINSCILLYYSGSKSRLNKPAEKGVLEVWRAFNNVELGMNILKEYAAYKDGNEKSNINKSMVSYLE
jgi:hypothetical protein